MKLYPQSEIPFIARGIFYYELAYDYRGTKWSSKTRPDQFEDMYATLQKAVPDLNKATELNKQTNAAWEYLIYASVFL